jgi:hypothetical protein
LIEDGLHLLVVGNGHVQEILVLQEFLRMRWHFVSSVEHNSMNRFNKEVIGESHQFVHHNGRAFAMK